MKEHPIIFSTELIPKILDNTKTMTRRTYGLKTINMDADAWCISGQVGAEWGFGNLHCEDDVIVKCPYGQVGDRLWVRETHAFEIVDAIESNAHYDEESEYHLLPRYKADGFDLTNCCDIEDGKPIGWRPSIHMPRWASRITLEITEVRVERLQKISDSDILAEGTQVESCYPPSYLNIKTYARTRFQKLWDSLNAKRGYGWASNCWVWVLTFKRI